VFTGAQAGLWQVAVVWGFGVSIAIYATAGISGAHLNPAVSLAFALVRRDEFPARNLPWYWAGQMAGAVAAGAVVFAAFATFIGEFEAARGIVRGGPGSELSGMAFGEYFPNPAVFGTGEAAEALVSPLMAFSIEAFGTGVLAFVIFALTDRRNRAGPGTALTPFFIGFTVAVLISLFAPATQGGWNPARDFGPRIIAAAVGWGDIAIPGPRGGFWVYIAGPLVGAPLGAWLSTVLLRRGERSGRGTDERDAAAA
jgi:MIP family channel proteins